MKFYTQVTLIKSLHNFAWWCVILFFVNMLEISQFSAPEMNRLYSVKFKMSVKSFCQALKPF